MDTINCLGLQVVDANISTFNGKVLNILKVEVRFVWQILIFNCDHIFVSTEIQLVQIVEVDIYIPP